MSRSPAQDEAFSRWEQLVGEWAERARTEEIERIVALLREELARRHEASGDTA